MATAQAPLTPASDTTPAVISIPAKELSGTQWVERFPGSSSLDDLAEPFQGNVRNFLTAITEAGGNYRVVAAYRPPERAYLMHYSSKVAQGQMAASTVPATPGVAIEWGHGSTEVSKSAASAMRSGYGIVFPPALESDHTRRLVIDMTITGMVGKEIKNANGDSVSIAQLSDLNAVGEAYGVIKLASDPPHWSSDGH